MSQMNQSRSAHSPCSIRGHEYLGIGLDIDSLLLRSEFDHSDALRSVEECGENLPFHSEVGVSHVSAFFNFRQAQCHPLEVACGHNPPQSRRVVWPVFFPRPRKQATKTDGLSHANVPRNPAGCASAAQSLSPSPV